MNEWLKFALMMGISVPVGLGIGAYLHWRQRDSTRQYDNFFQRLRWPYHVALSVSFLTMGVATNQALPFRILYFVFAVSSLGSAVHSFIRDRTQFHLRHLFIATTVAAIVAALFRWFGMKMTYVLLVASATSAMGLFLLEWKRSRVRK